MRVFTDNIFNAEEKMQKDMHYYGTYVIARTAGLKPKDARVIAYSAQFVDDSTHINSEIHKDGGMLYGVATAHHSLQVAEKYFLHNIIEKIKHKKIGNIEQRRIWIPFHFYPGNEGNTFSEKLICRKNSPLVNEMFDNYINHIKKECPFILQLIGIASHVYMDTFSHYGFSGKSSRENKVHSNSFKFKTQEKKHQQLLLDFNKKYKREYITENWRNKSHLISLLNSISKYKIPFLHELIHGGISYLAEIGSGALGHGAVATLPDQPYLEWEFSYEKGDKVSKRNNPQTYLEGCENLHIKLKAFAEQFYTEKPQCVSFSEIQGAIKKVLSFYGEECDRLKKWIEYIKTSQLFQFTDEDKNFLQYNYEDWENQKKEKFHNLVTSSEVVDLPIYKFHQASDYHRHYTLKNLLPKYGIIVN